MWHLLCHAGKALLRMLRPRIKRMELGLQAGHHKLVHLDVRPAGGRIEACVTASQTVQVRALMFNGRLANVKVPHGASDAVCSAEAGTRQAAVPFRFRRQVMTVQPDIPALWQLCRSPVKCGAGPAGNLLEDERALVHCPKQVSGRQHARRRCCCWRCHAGPSPPTQMHCGLSHTASHQLQSKCSQVTPPMEVHPADAIAHIAHPGCRSVYWHCPGRRPRERHC